MSAVLVERTPRPASLRDAICELGGACALMLVVMDAEPARRNRAKARLFEAAMTVAWMILDEDGLAEAWLSNAPMRGKE
jgi:hypothetical protein